jgi:hypothetical protein
MEDIRKLFQETRQWRLQYVRTPTRPGNVIEAAACAIREKALLDAMTVLGLSNAERQRMEKLTWTFTQT